MDRELRDYLDARFQRLEDEAWLTRALIEEQSRDTRQLAEGIIATNEKLDLFRVEVAGQIEQMRLFVALPFRELRGRIEVLESWKERSERDPVEIVRERYGRPRT